MKFKKVIKHIYYETWVRRKYNYTIRVYALRSGMAKCEKYYHFSTVHRNGNKYSSLNENIYFSSFKLACQAAEQWVNDHKIEEQGE
jgi:hypothetical protein